MKDNLLDLFYNFVVKEAATGRVDCYFTYNILFNTKVVEDNIEIISEIDKLISEKKDVTGDMSSVEKDISVLVPTLFIKNKKEFDKLLIEYVHKALDFYQDDDFCEEVRNCHFIDKENEKGISKEKTIMTLLWSNATVEDFHDPCSYLRKRIAFFESSNLEKYLYSETLGYSEVLNADIVVKIVKNGLENETPFSINLFLRDCENGEIVFEFPRVYLGIYDENGYIYAIQNSKDRFIHVDKLKRIERKFYGVNSGFDLDEDSSDFGNLKDVMPSFLIAANIVMGMFREMGISNVYVPSILVSRWNGKMLSLEYKEKRLNEKGIEKEERVKILQDIYEKNLMLQSRLTEKYLRLFRRLGYHHSTIGIHSLPMDFSSELILKIYEGEDICNNFLLDETYSFHSNEKKLKK